MFEQRCFRLREAFTVAVVVVVLASLLVVGCDNPFGSRRGGHGRRMQNGTQVRGIQQALVLFSFSNNEFYPGYTPEGNDDFLAIGPTATKWGCNALSDTDIGKIYAILLDGEYFTPEYMISPADDVAVQADAMQTPKPIITNANYSYAMLDMNDAGSNRRDEWRDTNNSQAPMVADPSSDIRPLKTVTYHSDVASSKGNSDKYYEGDIAWNDNHVTFESKALFDPGTLKMGDTLNAAALNPFKNKANDGAKFIW